MSDNLTPAQRSYCMSRVKGRDTGLERLIRSALHTRGFRFRKHVRSLPGTPDIVFPAQRVAVFLDGDFWHGYRFPLWADKLSSFWRAKISRNRERDRRNFRRLRRLGWRVVRVWQHENRADPVRVLEKILVAVRCGEARAAAGSVPLFVVAERRDGYALRGPRRRAAR